MFKFFRIPSATITFVVLNTLPAFAAIQKVPGNGRGNYGNSHWSNALAAPEIDASSGFLAVAAIVALMLYYLERRKQVKNDG